MFIRNYRRDEDRWVLRDFVTEQIGLVILDFEIGSLYPETAYAFWVPCGFANDVHSIDDIIGREIVVRLDTGASTTDKRLRLVQYNNGSAEIWGDKTFAYQEERHYWLTLTRAAGIVTLKIYSDPERYTLLDTITLTGTTNENFRYFYTTQTRGSGSSNQQFNGYSELFEFLQMIPWTSASASLSCGFSVSGSKNLKGAFSVNQQSASVDLKAGFKTNLGIDEMPCEFIVRHSCGESPGCPELKAGFNVNQFNASSNLNAGFLSKRCYDFTNSLGFAFWWWGAGGDDLIDVVLFTPTGNFVSSFADGPSTWRFILIKWEAFKETRIDGSRPDKSRICGMIWIAHTPGLRRLDRPGAYRCYDLKCGFIVLHTTLRNLKAGFRPAYDMPPFNMPAGFIVRHTSIRELPGSFTSRFAQNLRAGFNIRQGIEDLKAGFFLMALSASIDFSAKMFIGEDFLTYTEVDGDTI